MKRILPKADELKIERVTSANCASGACTIYVAGFGVICLNVSCNRLGMKLLIVQQDVAQLTVILRHNFTENAKSLFGALDVNCDTGCVTINIKIAV